MKRIGIIAIQHESNTFLPRSTTIDDFRADAFLKGEVIRDAYSDSRHEVGGFFHGLDEANLTAVPILLALATPSGVITHEAFDLLIETMCDELNEAGPLDGLLVAPHGAAVSEKHRDADGYWLKLVRERVGDVPIVCTLDPHANVSDRMIQACDATIAYRTNPHVDQYETGIRAADLLARTLCGEFQPVQAIARPPVAISMDRQETAAQPCLALYEQADDLLQLPNVISDSVMLGFPYADVHEMGSSLVVVSNGDKAVASRHANSLANWLSHHRQDYACQSIGTEQAIQQASRGPTPVCLLDMGDNVGGGGPGDGTILVHALESAHYGKSLVCICDPQAVTKANDSGVGAILLLSMGAKTDQLHGRPFVKKVRVVGMHQGRFTESDVRHGGRTGYDMGPTAVVTTDLGTTVILTTHRVPPFSLKQITSCDIDPLDFHTIVAKGVNAPLAAYRDTCPRFIRVNTPGITSADMLQLEFVHRRRPLFPFEDLSSADF